MNSPNALPVYIQISEMLIREINAGHYLDGERLPPERQMAAQLGISVGTLRKSLHELEKKRLLERRQGSGNYIRARNDVESVYAFFRIELVEGGGLPTARVLSVSRKAKPETAPPFGPSADGHRIRRLRFLNQKPVVLEEIWLDGSFAKSLEVPELSESLYHFYKARLGLWITRAEDRVAISTVPQWAPSEFGLAPDAPCGYVERTSWAQNGAPVEYSRSWYDAGQARYVTRIS